MLKSIKICFILLTTAIVSEVISNSSGPNASYTGAPSEGNCTSCHGSYGLQTSGTNWGRIRLKNNFTGGGYIPDSTYTLTLTYKESGISTFGFELTCLDVSSNSAAGTYTSTDARTQTLRGTVGGKTRYYVSQTSKGTADVASDSTSWVFQWKAPNSNMGKVRFYINLNSANGNGGTSGDYIYEKTIDAGTSSLLSVASIKLSETLLCSGSNLSFNGSGTNSPKTFKWTFPSGSPNASTQQNPNISYASAGSYMAILQVSNSKGPSLPDTFRFKVLQGATKPKISPDTTSSLCQGDSLKLVTYSIAGHSLRWFPGNYNKLVVYAKDSGNYYSIATNTNGCKEKSDPIKILVKQKPTGTIEVKNAKLNYCAGSSIEFAMRSAFGDSFGNVSNNGPFFRDTLFKTIANASKKTLSGWAKSTNGCVSKSFIKILSIADSAPKANLIIADTQLTQITFSWNKQNAGRGYYISEDLGKTWNESSNSGNDTSHTIVTGTGNTGVDLWLKYRVNTDCEYSSISKVRGKTKSCSPLSYSVKVKPGPRCVNGSVELEFSSLPSRFSIQVNGGTFSSKPNPKLYLSQKSNAYNIAVIDSSQLVCGTSDKKLYISADSLLSISTSLDSYKTLSTCAATLAFEYRVLGDYDSVWALVGKAKISLPNPNACSVKVKNGDSVIVVVRSNLGCTLRSNACSIIVNQKPKAEFAINKQANLYQMLPDDSSGAHNWYTTSTPAWSSSDKKPVLDVQPYAGKTIVIIHEILKVGDSCFSQSNLELLIPALSVNQLLQNTILVYPNPTEANATIHISSIYPMSEIKIFSMLGKELDIKFSSENPYSAKGFVHLAKGIYQLRIRMFDGTEKVSAIQIQ